MNSYFFREDSSAIGLKWKTVEEKHKVLFLRRRVRWILRERWRIIEENNNFIGKAKRTKQSFHKQKFVACQHAKQKLWQSFGSNSIRLCVCEFFNRFRVRWRLTALHTRSFSIKKVEGNAGSQFSASFTSKLHQRCKLPALWRNLLLHFFKRCGKRFFLANLIINSN